MSNRNNSIYLSGLNRSGSSNTSGSCITCIERIYIYSMIRNHLYNRNIPSLPSSCLQHKSETPCVLNLSVENEKCFSYFRLNLSNLSANKFANNLQYLHGRYWLISLFHLELCSLRRRLVYLYI